MPQDYAILHVNIERMLNGDNKYQIGQMVKKYKGSNWHGQIVGFYSTSLTPIGYVVESHYESGSCQLYPESALERWDIV